MDRGVGYNIVSGGLTNIVLSGENSPHYGKPKDKTVCDKISKTLKGRKLSDSHRENVVRALKSRPHLT